VVAAPRLFAWQPSEEIVAVLSPRPIAVATIAAPLAISIPAHATTYLFTTITPPGTPAGDSAFGSDINDPGQVPVNSAVPNVSSDFADIDDIYNIHTHVYTPFPAYPGAAPLSTAAYGINELGQIVGDYLDPNGNTQALVASPVPDPAGWAMMLVGLGALGAFRRGAWPPRIAA
jgi:hypothetical protein